MQVDETLQSIGQVIMKTLLSWNIGNSQEVKIRRWQA